MRLAEDTKIEDIKVEVHKRPHFVVAIPTLGMVPIEFVVTFARLQMPVNGVSGSCIVKGMEIGQARNYIAHQVLKMNPLPPFIFFLGDDMLPPWDGLIKLYEEMENNKWDVLTGLYYMKGEPPTPLTWRHDYIGRLMPGTHYQVGEVIPVDVTGLDFTLIRTSIFSKLKDPYFKTGPTLVGKDNTIVSHTEDVFFYDQCREHKMKVGVHSGVRVAHLDVKSGMIF